MQENQEMNNQGQINFGFLHKIEKSLKFIFSHPYILLTIILSYMIYSDLHLKNIKSLVKAQEEQEKCRILFNQNKCHRVVPLTEMNCRLWELCISQDMQTLSYFYTSTYSSLLLDIVDQASNKVLLFFLSLIFIYLYNHH
jgi:hypothetical protein